VRGPGTAVRGALIVQILTPSPLRPQNSHDNFNLAVESKALLNASSLGGSELLLLLCGKTGHLKQYFICPISASDQSEVWPKKDLTTHIAIVVSQTSVVGEQMPERKLTKLELQIMEVLWIRNRASISEIQESFSEKDRPAYTTIQTTVYRLEEKNAVRRVKKVGNFHIFEAVVTRNAAQRRLIDDLLALFGGRTQPVMAHLIESGKLTIEDIKEAEKTLRRCKRKEK
jgi:BlaI family penicillinase repressor